MKLAALLMLIVSIALGIFAWWGIYTPAGRTRYDEMDGIYPAVAGLVAILLLITALFLWFFFRGRA